MAYALLIAGHEYMCLVLSDKKIQCATCSQTCSLSRSLRVSQKTNVNQMQTKTVKVKSRPDVAFTVALKTHVKPVRAVQPRIPRPTPSEIAAMEFGFIQAERGNNLQFALAEFTKLFEL